MIDPKLNDQAAETSGTSAAEAKNTQAAQSRLEKVSSGLSVNETIASNAALSVGGKGVDTSGVSAGAGAGAGMMKPSATGGSMPEVVPGGRGSGTTTLGSSDARSPSSAMPGANATGGDYTDAEIAARAYQAWCERGCPIGSPEVDWERAEQELRTERAKARAARA